jgi:predicted transport protein
MWNKFTYIFKRKKTRFKETIKKEKRRFYMFNKKKSSNFSCKRKKNKIFQLKINFNFNKKVILYFSLFFIVLALVSLLYIFK